MDLFDDLPEPLQSRGPVSAVRGSSTEEQKQQQEEEEEEEEVEKRSKDLKRKREDAAEKEEEEIKKVCKGVPVLRGFVAARRGEREEMQDAHVLLPDMSECLSALPAHISRVSYFAVFNGHGGTRASRFAAENLHHVLGKKFPSGEPENLDKLIKKCLLETFKQTDEDFLKKASSQKPPWKDGSTATCVLVLDDTVYVANLGDSRAVLCREEEMEETEEEEGEETQEREGRKRRRRRRTVTLALSKEHNPTIYEERMRIQRAGGTVRDGRVLGVLEVSRSFGDGQYKRCGVISTPDLRRCQLTANDRFLLLACDGLFKVFSADEAVKFVVGVLQGGAVEQRAGLTQEELRFESACQQLASEAVRRGCADNVTVILLSVGF